MVLQVPQEQASRRHSSYRYDPDSQRTLPYEVVRDAHWLNEIKPSKESNLGAARALFDL